MYRTVCEPVPVARPQEQKPDSRMSGNGLRLAGATLALVGIMGATGCGTEASTSHASATQTAPDIQPEVCDALPNTAAGWARSMITGSNWLTGDGVFLQKLPDGRAVAFTSDSIGGNEQDGHRFNRNAMVVFCGDKAKSVAPQGEVIPSNENGEWFWPVQSLVKDGKMYVLATRNAKTGGAFSFKHMGAEIAVFDLPSSTAEVPTFERMISMPTSHIPEVGPDGKHTINMAASMTVKDDNLYLFGGHVYDAPLSFGRNVYLARVPIKELESTTAWRYWNGSKWGSSITEAKPIIDTHKQEGQDAAWTTYVEKDGTFRMIGKKDGWFGDQIGMWTAKTPDAPQGPYTYTKLVEGPIVQPHKSEDCHRNYLAYAQPDIRLKSGKMLVTLSNNIEALQDVTKMVKYPGDFNVQWIEVPTKPTDKRTPTLAPQLQPTAPSCTLDYEYKPQM